MCEWQGQGFRLEPTRNIDGLRLLKKPYGLVPPTCRDEKLKALRMNTKPSEKLFLKGIEQHPSEKAKNKA